MNSIRVSAIAIAAGFMVYAGAAAAQELNEETDFGLPQFYGRGKNVSVLERERPEYQAVGIHAGGFTVYPKLITGIDFTDNLFAANNNSTAPAPFNGPKSDVGFIVNPSVHVQSNWGRHSLTVIADVKNEAYADHPSEDRTAYTVQTYGRIDVHGESYINIGVDGEHDYEARGSAATQVQAAKPVSFDTEAAYARGVYEADRLRASLDVDFRNYHYFDVAQINLNGPQSVIDESLRDFTEGRLSGRLDYALTPDEAVFGKIGYASGDYLNGATVPPTAPVGTTVDPKRNFDEVRFLTGANFDITALARGEIGLGYVDRTYQAGFYHGVSGLAASAKVEYFPTQLVTVTLTGQRLVQDAAFSNAGGYFQNTVSLGADYEFKRNIIISLAGGLEEDDFVGITRSDTDASFRLGGTYLLTRYVGFGTVLQYDNRASTGLLAVRGPVYDETRLTFNLVFQR